MQELSTGQWASHVVLDEMWDTAGSLRIPWSTVHGTTIFAVFLVIARGIDVAARLGVGSLSPGEGSRRMTVRSLCLCGG